VGEHRADVLREELDAVRRGAARRGRECTSTDGVRNLEYPQRPVKSCSDAALRLSVAM
jgi:hypothetical protein